MFVLDTNVLSAMAPRRLYPGSPRLLFTASICQAELRQSRSCRQAAASNDPHAATRMLESAPTGEVRFVNRLFRLAV
jgi:hypothetical protein